MNFTVEVAAFLAAWFAISVLFALPMGRLMRHPEIQTSFGYLA